MHPMDCCQNISSCIPTTALEPIVFENIRGFNSESMPLYHSLQIKITISIEVADSKLLPHWQHD